MDGHSRSGRCLAAVLLVASLTCSCTQESDVPRPLVLESVTVGFSRTNPRETAQGKLKFRGGVELRSIDPDFGGLSGLLVSEDGRSFISNSDESHWITGSLGYENGNLSEVVGGWIAPMLDLDGQPMVGKEGDAEGLASAGGNDLASDLFVSFEGNHRVWRYAFGTEGVRAVPTNVALPQEALMAPRNGGLEGITRISDGMLLAVSERFRNPAGNYRAWLVPYVPSTTAQPRHGKPAVPAALPKPRAVSIRPIPPYAMTDVRQLPNGDILTLERRYDAVHGLGVQMRRILAADFRKAVEAGPAIPLDGEIILELDSNYEIDNMEGLSVRTGEHGETLVYMVSDDNFNEPLQRTLLLMFELLH